MERLPEGHLRAWREGEEYKQARAFQRHGGSLSCDEFAVLFHDEWLRFEIHREAGRRSFNHEDYSSLWRVAWGGVCMAPQNCTPQVAFTYADRAIDKLYRCSILPRRQELRNRIKKTQFAFRGA